jgi:hypothetical protein
MKLLCWLGWHRWRGSWPVGTCGIGHQVCQRCNQRRTWTTNIRGTAIWSDR